MKMILPTLAAALAAPVCLFAAEPVTPVAADTKWREVSAALAPCVGTFTQTYDKFLATTSLCAPFVGNGNFRAALAGNRVEQDLLEVDTGTWIGGRPNFTFGAFHYNGAYLEFLHTAMLQNEDGDGLRLFPSWPQERPAKFVRLRAKGAFLVSAELKNGVVCGVRITSEKGRDLTVVNPWPGKKVCVVRTPLGAPSPGSGLPAEPAQLSAKASTINGERFTLKTAPGELLELQLK